MSPLWTLFLVLFRPIASFTLNKTDNCTSYNETIIEIQCPPVNGSDIITKEDRIILHVEEDMMKIDCYNFTKFRLDLLPNVTIPEVTRLEMNDCPLPPPSFKVLLHHFEMLEVRVLLFENFGENVTLTSQCFEGLSTLKKLKLNELNFIDVDEDVFRLTPNLSYLEMHGNRNLTLASNMFRDLTKLRVLYLENNGLEVLPDGVFDTLISLKFLNLYGNQLKEIKGSTFSKLQNLITLDLNSNQIGTISEDSFKGLAQLQAINLSGNKLTTLSPNIFKFNTNIEIIYFKLNQKLQPPDFLLANLENLLEVDLSNCTLTSIPVNIFANSTKLQIVSFQKNQLDHLSPLLFRKLVNLKNLDLSENLLTTVERDTLQDLTSLEQIKLQKNRIRTMDNRVFSNKKNLRTINLSHNQLVNTRSGLEECPSVETLDLSYNWIEHVEEVMSPTHLSSLEELDLSNNLISEIKLRALHISSGKMSVDLANNNITRVCFDDIDSISNGSTTLYLNSIKCDCHSFQLFEFLQDKNGIFKFFTADLVCNGPEELENQYFAKLSPEQLNCPVENPICPPECLCRYSPHSKSFIADCSCKNLTDYPSFGDTRQAGFTFNQTELTLKGNELTTGPRSSLQGYKNVTKLDLSNNKIKKIKWLPPKLEILHLANNDLNYLPTDVLTSLKTTSLQSLSLGVNPWSCGCETTTLLNFLRENRKKLMDIGSIRCTNTTLVLNLSEEELCPDKMLPYLVVPLLASFLLITVLLVVFYRHQREIKIWLFAHDLCLRCISEKELDKDKKYDAFISYCQKDEDFVVQKLLPDLEGGSKPYKLCLHYRDWTPGEVITTQIHNSVFDSRRTLVVLSKNFLESVWGKMEFRTAHTHAMTEGRARVIIVLYGDIEIDKLDDELKAYLKSNTYVKWGDPYFWNKLKFAMPHSKRIMNRKIENVMKCIDDKFTLVTEDKSSPGTTPPVLALNSLKKHPFSFASGQEMSTPPAEAGSLIVSTCS